MAERDLRVKLSADSREFRSAMTAASGSLTNMKRAAGLASAAIATGLVAAMVDATRQAAKFERQVAELAKLVGPDVAGPLADAIADLANQIPVARDRLFEVAEAAARLGVRGTENIRDFAQVMGEIGLATDLAADQAATAMARIAKITGTPINQIRNLASAINEASNTMAISFSEVVDASLRAAPALSSLGASADQVAALAAAVGEVSASSERAGTRLNRLASALQDPSGVETFAAALGVTASEFERMRAEDPAELVLALARAMRRGGEGARILSAELEQTSLKVLRALAQNLEGAEGAVRRLSGAFREGTSIGEEYSRFVDTAQARTQVLQNRFQDLRTEIGDNLLPAFVATLEKTNFLIEALNRLAFSADDTPLTGMAAVAQALEAAAQNTSLLSDEAAEAQAEIRSMSEQLAKADRPAFLELAAEALREASTGAISLEEAGRRVDTLFQSLKTSGTQTASSTREVAQSSRQATADLTALLATLEETDPAVSGAAGGLAVLAEALASAGEEGRDLLDEYVEFLTTLDEISTTKVDADAIFGELIDSTNELIDDTEVARDNVLDLARELERGARSAIDFARAVGLIGDSAAATLNSIVNLGANVSDLISAIGSGVGIGGLAGPIGGALGAVGGIVSSIFGGVDEEAARVAARMREMQQAMKEFQEEMQRISNDAQVATADLSSARELVRSFGAATTQALIELFTGFEQLSPAGFRRQMDELGLSIADVQDFADRFGIEVDDLIQILATGEGDVQAAIEQINKLQAAFGNLDREALEAALQLEKVAAEFDKLRGETDLFIEIFDIEDVGRKFELLIQDMLEVLAGADMEGATSEMLAQLEKLLQLDLGTQEGIQQAEALIRALFEAGAPEGVPQEVFNRFLRELDRLLDNAREAGEELGDGMREGGFQRVNRITQIQFERAFAADLTRNSLLRDIAEFNRLSAQALTGMEIEPVSVPAGALGADMAELLDAQLGVQRDIFRLLDDRLARPLDEDGLIVTDRGGSQINVSVDVPVTVEGADDPEQVAQSVSERIERTLTRSLLERVAREIEDDATRRGRPPQRQF